MMLYISCGCEDEEHEVEIDGESGSSIASGEPLPCGRLVTDDDIETLQETYTDRVMDAFHDYDRD